MKTASSLLKTDATAIEEQFMASWGDRQQHYDELVRTIRELFEKQTEIVRENTEQVARLAQQTALLSVQVTTLASQQDALRSDFNTKWNELPRIYLPREEDRARGLEGRIASLEDYRISATRDISDVRLTIQQEVQKSFQDMQEKVVDQRQTIDGRTLSMWVTGFFLLANIIWSVLAHFILK